MEKDLYNPLPTILIKVVASQSCLSLKKKNAHTVRYCFRQVCVIFFCVCVVTKA